MQELTEESLTLKYTVTRNFGSDILNHFLIQIEYMDGFEYMDGYLSLFCLCYSYQCEGITTGIII